MFTGLVEKVGTLKTVKPRGNYKVLTIEAAWESESLTLGESIACDGVCLTVTSITDRSFEVDVSQESLSKSTFGSHRSGAKINLERALKAGERLGGHMVSGHIDDTGIVHSAKSIGDSLQLSITFDKRHDNLVVDKGSIAINGVSLTVNEARSGWLSTNIIPYTADLTNLGSLKKGDTVNLEFDIVGKYIIKMIGEENRGNLTIKKLRESGW